MANHKKATHHHGKAGRALANKDFKSAAHHFGHALAALRESATDDGSVGPDDIPEGGSEAATAPIGLRSRLANMKPKAKDEEAGA